MKLIGRPPPLRRANTNTTMPERRRPCPAPRRIVAGGRPPNLRTHVRTDDLSREGIIMVIFFPSAPCPVYARTQHADTVFRFLKILSVNPITGHTLSRRHFRIVNTLWSFYFPPLSPKKMVSRLKSK